MQHDRRQPAIPAAKRPGKFARRGALLGLLGSAAILARWQLGGSKVAAQPVDSGAAADWNAFTARFVTADGRVVDTGNGGVTHSEGQAYGMLFAAHSDDRVTFDTLLGWTRRELRRPDDALHSWRYRPDAAVKVDDPNNATDADLLMALALLRAAERWDAPAYAELGQAIGRDILRKCVSYTGGRTLLLPGAYGFTHPRRIVVNPSYYVFPALAALDRAVPDESWGALYADGLRLLRAGRFGHWGLPCDWLEVAGDRVAPAEGWPARFSWDAARVPLHLVWAGLGREPAVTAAASFWGDPTTEARPAWVELYDDTVSPFPASRGINAVAALIRAPRPEAERLPRVADAEDYYAAALVMLTRMVARELSQTAA